MIMTDDQNVSSLSVLPRTQQLLASAGTTFSNNFVSYPLCCPSRATYLTGQYPHNHGVLGNSPPDGGYAKLRGNETVPVWLSRAGYQTAHIGKYLNGYGTQNPTEVPPGWRDWHGLVDPTTYRMWGYTINHNGTTRTYGQQDVEDPALYQTDVLSALATNYIDSKAPGTQPFLLSFAPLAPHAEAGWASTNGNRNPRPAPRHRGMFGDAPLPRPPSFDEADVSDKPAQVQALPRLSAAEIARITKDYRSRLEALQAVDDAVAAIVGRLAQHGELANTLIIFTSDNGWLQGEHRIPRGKVYAYEESSRVPLIVRGPGVPAGATNAAFVSNVDLAATILDAADAVPGITIDGRSLIPIAQDPGSVAGRQLLIETGPKPSGNQWYAAVRGGRWAYVEHSTGERELYDQQLDPYQLVSRHNDPAYATVRAALAAKLHELQLCAGATC
ncbi:MAG TPA: sulfatase [Pseudonocardiaceae bacterium]|nr:sulfatase [Pseudonocardiaceae bacterium]